MAIISVNWKHQELTVHLFLKFLRRCKKMGKKLMLAYDTKIFVKKLKE